MVLLRTDPKNHRWNFYFNPLVKHKKNMYFLFIYLEFFTTSEWYETW